MGENMKRVALLLLFFPILVCWGGDKEQAPLWQEKGEPISSNQVKPNDLSPELMHVSYFIVPPHIFLDEDKNIRGAIYDLISDYIAPEMGIKFKWEKLPTSIYRQSLNIKEGKNYISCFFVFSSERNTFMIFSKKPYYYVQSIIAVHKSNPLKEVRSAGDINHMVFGYNPNAVITPFMRDPSIKFDFVQNPDFLKLNLKKTIAHRIDGIYSPGKASTLVYLKKFGMIDEFKIIDLPEKPTPVHVAFPKGHKSLADKFDQAFERLDGQQLYLKLLNRYIDVSKLKHVSKIP